MKLTNLHTSRKESFVTVIIHDAAKTKQHRLDIPVSMDWLRKFGEDAAFFDPEMSNAVFLSHGTDAIEAFGGPNFEAKLGWHRDPDGKIHYETKIFNKTEEASK